MVRAVNECRAKQALDYNTERERERENQRNRSIDYVNNLGNQISKEQVQNPLSRILATNFLLIRILAWQFLLPRYRKEQLHDQDSIMNAASAQQRRRQQRHSGVYHQPKTSADSEASSPE